ncbi:TPA: ribbon-helix-helix protein, CopG family [Candidatus Woesearchaeota archaeon]|nr:ribbon-helix-helix protein, CopG family [Candidatus Woesearchaeota archaeon]
MHGSDDSDGLEAVNVRLPDELLRAIDLLVKKGVFSSRSEAIREFCREYAIEAQRDISRDQQRTAKHENPSHPGHDARPSAKSDARGVQHG